MQWKTNKKYVSYLMAPLSVTFNDLKGHVCRLLCLRGICCHRVSVCLSVCLSEVGVVQKLLHVKSRRQRCTIAQGLCSFFDAKDNYDYLRKCQMEWPQSGANAGGVGKSIVLRPVQKSPAETPCRRKFVFIRLGGPRPRRCAGGRIPWCHQHLTMIIFETWCLQLLSSWHQCHVAITFFLLTEFNVVLTAVTIEKSYTAEHIRCGTQRVAVFPGT